MGPPVQTMQEAEDAINGAVQGLDFDHEMKEDVEWTNQNKI